MEKRKLNAASKYSQNPVFGMEINSVCKDEKNLIRGKNMEKEDSGKKQTMGARELSHQKNMNYVYLKPEYE